VLKFQRFKSEAISANWATPKVFASRRRLGVLYDFGGDDVGFEKIGCCQ